MHERGFSQLDVEILLSILSNLGVSLSEFRADIVRVIQNKLNNEYNDETDANMRPMHCISVNPLRSKMSF